jgi:hypothetical protein
MTDIDAIKNETREMIIDFFKDRGKEDVFKVNKEKALQSLFATLQNDKLYRTATVFLERPLPYLTIVDHDRPLLDTHIPYSMEDKVGTLGIVVGSNNFDIVGYFPSLRSTASIGTEFCGLQNHKAIVALLTQEIVRHTIQSRRADDPNIEKRLLRVAELLPVPPR